MDEKQMDEKILHAEMSEILHNILEGGMNEMYLHMTKPLKLLCNKTNEEIDEIFEWFIEKINASRNSK